MQILNGREFVPDRRRAFRRSVFCVALAAACTFCRPSLADTASYTLRLGREDRRLLEVEAVVETTESELLMYADNYDASHLPGGWASYVRNLVATDGLGREVPLDLSGLSRWRLPSGVPQPLSLRYEVLIHHDQGNWPVGWDEAAYAKRDCDCVLLTGMAVFIGSATLRDIGVTFELPDSHEDRGAWRSVAPWARLAGELESYRAADFAELSEVAFVIGDMPVEEIRLGQAEIEIAVGRGLPAGPQLFRRAVEDYLRTLQVLLGEPPTGRFVIVANPDVYSGGGAFIRSVSMLFKDPPVWPSRHQWGHVVAHELVHLWNGHVLRYDVTEEWVKEGLTDYLSRLVQFRAGHLTEEQFFAAIVRGYPWYLAKVGEASLREAGPRKQELGVLLYDGGLYASLAIDIEIRRLTEGRVGLADVIGKLYREVPSRGGQVALGDLADTAASLGADDLGQFIRDLAESPRPVALDSLFGELGYELVHDAGEDRWTGRPQAAPSERAETLRRCLLSGC